MVLLDSCWSPYVWTNNIKTGSKVIAAYTVALSVILITLLIHQCLGGESTQMYSPMFETTSGSGFSTNTQLHYGLFCIFYFLLLIIHSGFMVYGINKYIRGFLLPWLVSWGFICFYQLLFGVWLIWTYYIYLHQILAAVVNWLWMSYNVYCWLCVYSMYRIIEKMQTPNIELLW